MLKSEENFLLSIVHCWNMLSALFYLYFWELMHWKHILKKPARHKNLKHSFLVTLQAEIVAVPKKGQSLCKLTESYFIPGWIWRKLFLIRFYQDNVGNLDVYWGLVWAAVILIGIIWHMQASDRCKNWSEHRLKFHLLCQGWDLAGRQWLVSLPNLLSQLLLPQWSCL